MNDRTLHISCIACAAMLVGAVHAEPVCVMPNVAVPDNSPLGVSVQVVVDRPGEVVDGLTVSLDIAHAWVGDLVVTIASPDGTVVTLLDRPGIPDAGPPAAGFPGPFGCGGAGVLATLTDTSPSPAETLCPLPEAGGPAITGDLAPTDPLTVFTGEPVSGAWVVTFSDVSAYDTGVVASVCLDIVSVSGCPADLAAPFGTLNFFDVSAYMSLFNAGDPGADFAAPFGSLNFFDVSAFISAYNAGCP